MSKSEFPRTYLGVPEKEVHKLIRYRAFRMKLPPSDLDDLQQRVLEALSKASFDPSLAQGARPRTFITSTINNKILAWKRAVSRQEKRMTPIDDLKEEFPPAEEDESEDRSGSPMVPEPFIAPEEQVDLQIDVNTALASLPQRERSVCIALGEGRNITEIAAQLGCGRDTVSRLIERVRARFAELGLAEWIGTKGDADAR